jgi:hypothetical protein
MSEKFQFTFDNLEQQYRAALSAGYKFLTCAEYAEKRKKLPSYTVVNRVDIDLSVKKADRLREIFDRLGVKATFFLRLHAPEYNPFSFESYRILKQILQSGHEIGYHSEIIDQAAIWSENAEDCLKRDLDVLGRMFGIQIKGVASHGGTTGLNNLDFWKTRKAQEYNLLYEAYDESDTFNLFAKSLYISDSEWTRWKCYDHGKLRDGDRRSFAEHLFDRPKLIYLLIHPDTYYSRHIYE